MWLALAIGCTSGPPDRPDGPAPTGVVTARPRNLLMISIDTLRRDHVDRYATDGVVRMPFLTGLLEASVVLDDHQQCSNWTFASTHCTLMGQYLTDLGGFPRMNGQPIPDGQPTLARILGEAGFQTALASTNINFSEEMGSGQGYDHYSLNRGGDATVGFSQGQVHLAAMLAEDAPWFLHVHLFDPHQPYLPPAEYVDPLGDPWELPYDLQTKEGQGSSIRHYGELSAAEQEHLERWVRGLYTGEARYADAELAAAWAAWDAAGHLDDTLVVFWTDHGEQLWEHGLHGHAKLLGGEENDGILAFWARGQEPVAWREPTHAVDLVPTVLDAMGVPPPPDLSGAVLGLADPHRPRFAATSAYAGEHQAVTLDGWKLQYSWASNGFKLWNRDVDPSEATDLVDEEPEQAGALWELLQPRVEQMDALIPEVSPSW